MLNLTDRQIADYFKRSYMAVDGLWFMKIEEKLGFDTALDLDVDVWKVMPKIQVRKLKALASVPEGLDGLFECFTTKLTLEGFTFETHKAQKVFEIRVSRCPWYDIILNANRRHIADIVGTRICTTEYPTWAAEFGKDITFALRGQLCKGDPYCRLCFSRLETPAP